MISHLSSCKIVSLSLVEVTSEKKSDGMTIVSKGVVPVARIIESSTESFFMFKGHEIKRLGCWTGPGYAIEEAEEAAKRFGIDKDSDAEIVANCVVTTRSVILSRPDSYSTVPAYDSGHPLLRALQAIEGHQTVEDKYDSLWSSRNTPEENAAKEAEIKEIIMRHRSPFQSKDDVNALFIEFDETARHGQLA